MQSTAANTRIPARAAATRRRGPPGHLLCGHGACELRQAPRPPANAGNAWNVMRNLPLLVKWLGNERLLPS
jgi:hypothetical protein